MINRSLPNQDRISVERMPYADVEVNLPPTTVTSVSVHLSGVCTLDWAPSGRMFTKQPTRGQVTVVPQGQTGLLRVRGGSCEILKIGIPEAAFADWAPEHPPTPLLDRFGVADPLVFQLGWALLGAHEQTGTVDSLYQDALSGALLAHLLKRHAQTDQAPIAGCRVQPLSARRASDAVAFMQENLTAEIGLDDIARELHLSTSHFAAQFRRSFGTTPARHLTWLRLERARGFLEAGRLPIAEIARRVGFRNASHFSQAFRAEFGESPTRWRAMKG